MEAHLGAYRLLQRIGRGGMAEVYLGMRQGAFGFARRVVVKCLHDHLCGSPDAETRFVEEAQLGSLLEHGNIVPVLDLGISGGRLFMVMEYVDGLDLKTLLAGYGALPLGSALHIGRCVSRGLAYAQTLRDPSGQALGIVHRDVSPSNILIARDGSVKLADFGVAKAAGREKTRAGVVKGKYAYMSPEQVEQGELDGRSDLFSLGAVLYEAVTGERLFTGNGPLEIMEAVRAASLGRALRELSGEGSALEVLLGKTLARERGGRFRDARALERALSTMLLEEGSAHPEEQLAAAVEEVLSAASRVGGEPFSGSSLESRAEEVARSLRDESVTEHFQRAGEGASGVDVSGLQALPEAEGVGLARSAGAASESTVTSRYLLRELRGAAPEDAPEEG